MAEPTFSAFEENPEELSRSIRFDVPGVILEDQLLMGSLIHAKDTGLMQHLNVSFLLQIENFTKKKKKKKQKAQEAHEQHYQTIHLEMDYQSSFESFEATMIKAKEIYMKALEKEINQIVFIACTHGDNESAVVCMALLVLVEKWTLDKAYRHVVQKRHSSAPRKAYIQKLQQLEEKVNGKGTLSWHQIGPSFQELMSGLRGKSSDHIEQPDAADDHTDVMMMGRSSMVTNCSLMPQHTGGARDSMVITQSDHDHLTGKIKTQLPRTNSRQNLSSNKCIIQ